jgi:hypothetical protein
MNAIERVRKWEKRWISINDTTLKLYKWVPTSVLASASNSATEITEPNTQQQQQQEHHQNGGMEIISPKMNHASKLNTSGGGSTKSSTNAQDKAVFNLDENAQDSMMGSAGNKPDATTHDTMSGRHQQSNNHNNHHHHHNNHSHSQPDEHTNDNSQSSNSSLSLNTVPTMMPMCESALTDSESNPAGGSGGLRNTLSKSSNHNNIDTEDDSMTK